MLAVGIIVASIILVTVATIFGVWKGVFGSVGSALQGTSRSGSRLFNSALVVVYFGGAIALPLIFIIGNRDNSNAQVGGIHMTAAEAAGRELFAEHCAVCHTLAADNAVGKIGPNLDVLRPSDALVLKTIANGCVQKQEGSGSTCLGYGTMPADIVEGRQAQDIAAFVARIAGHA